MKITHPHHDRNQVRTRIAVALLFVLILLATLMLRMAWLQITHHEKYQELADGNRIRLEPIAPIRGRILDRNGIVLADNQTVYVLELHRDELPRPRTLNAVVEQLQALSPQLPTIDDNAIRHLSQQWQKMNRHLPFTIARITEEEAAKFAVDAWQHPGFVVNAVAQRYYPYGTRAAHAIGYVGRITIEDLRSLDVENYRNTDFVGRSGIEQSHEAELHGQTGLRYMEVDAKGRPIRELDRIPPTSGKDLILTIDLELQTFAENLLGDRKGAIVAIDPRNGEVLALASTPSFDPNEFVAGMRNQDYQALIKDPQKPLLNRAIQSRYPPGSTIKPFMGLVALDNGMITASSKKFAGPSFEYKGMVFRDWKKEGHGTVDLDLAITQSCDVFFYELALDMTINRIDAGLAPFGFGEKTGIDLPTESSGILPSPAWKRRTYNKPWYPGETIITGIGQGYMLTTPLQLASATATLSMQGKRYRPHMLQSDDDFALPSVQLKQNNAWKTVIDAMTHVMTAPTGTGRRAKPLIDSTMAGKTGTAQIVGFAKDTKYNAKNFSEDQLDHALFVGFAPVADPKIAVAVIIENGGHGGETAAPLAALVSDLWIKKSSTAP
ncbi:MAG: penicillin-binding protein 2 [Thiotrichales bacterium]|nr:penicillin-binding protein 2 [Thiotrichales bacterium]